MDEKSRIGRVASDDLQAKLVTVQAECDRATKQRDYALRLLRQQQTLNTAHARRDALRAYFEDAYFYMKRKKVVAQIYATLPIPLALKQFVKNIAVKP